MSKIKQVRFSGLCVLLSFFIFLAAANATIYFSNGQKIGADQKTIGEESVIYYFKVSAATVTNFQNLRFSNSSTSVPFGYDHINKVTLYRDNGNQVFEPGVGDTLVAFKTFSGSSYSGSQTFDSIFTESIATTTGYFVLYNIDDDAAIDSTFQWQIVEAFDGVNWYEPASGFNNNVSFETKANGITFNKDMFKSPIDGLTPAAGLTDFPVLELVLHSNKTSANVVLRSLKIKNKDNNFRTSTELDRIIKVTLLLDAGNNGYKGKSNETLIGEYILPTNNNSDGLLEMYITTANRQTFVYYNNNSSNEKKYFVLFDLGPGFPSNQTFSCALNGGTWYDATTPTQIVQMKGGLPAGDIQYTAKDALVTLKSSQDDASARSWAPLAGQKNVKMATYYLDVNSAVSDCTWVIYNEGGNFKSNGDGVTRVSLYQKSGATEKLYASQSVFGTDHKTCELKNVNLNEGTNQQFYITYDFGLNARSANPAPAPSTLVISGCKLNSIKDGNVAFSGIVPAPQIGCQTAVSSSRLWIQFVSTNVTSVRPGDSFTVEIGASNISFVTDGSGAATPITLIPSLCYPKFYANTIEGNDISNEYYVTRNLNPSWVIPASMVISNFPVVTYSFTVVANNLRTNGPVIIDAQAGYYNKDLAEVIFQRHYRTGELHPAAENYDSQDDKTRMINVSGAKSYTSSFPDYIDRVETRKDQYSSLKRFMNNDLIESNSQMYIYFANEGKNLDLNSIVVKLNGQVMHTNDSTKFTVSSTNIWIKDIGSDNGIITIDGYSGTVALATTVINFSVANGFEARDLLGSPNPYNPDAGDCVIGFYMSEDGDYDIHIYDASGAEILKEEGIKANLGYNYYSWDGSRKNGKKVGRGVYLVKVKAKGSKDKIITTKIGVK